MTLLNPTRRALFASAALFLITACADQGRDSILGPPALNQGGSQGLEKALAAQQRHTAALMRIPGVAGTSVGLLPTGEAVVRVYLEHGNVSGIPEVLDDVPVRRQVTGRRQSAIPSVIPPSRPERSAHAS